MRQYVPDKQAVRRTVDGEPDVVGVDLRYRDIGRRDIGAKHDAVVSAIPVSVVVKPITATIEDGVAAITRIKQVGVVTFSAIDLIIAGTAGQPVPLNSTINDVVSGRGLARRIGGRHLRHTPATAVCKLKTLNSAVINPLVRHQNGSGRVGKRDSHLGRVVRVSRNDQIFRRNSWSKFQNIVAITPKIIIKDDVLAITEGIKIGVVPCPTFQPIISSATGDLIYAGTGVNRVVTRKPLVALRVPCAQHDVVARRGMQTAAIDLDLVPDGAVRERDLLDVIRAQELVVAFVKLAVHPNALAARESEDRILPLARDRNIGRHYAGLEGQNISLAMRAIDKLFVDFIVSVTYPEAIGVVTIASHENVIAGTTV